LTELIIAQSAPNLGLHINANLPLESLAIASLYELRAHGFFREKHKLILDSTIAFYTTD